MLRRTAATTVFVAALALGACSSEALPEPGHPSMSNRPEVVSMVGIEPCAVITDNQIAELGIALATKYDDPPAEVTGNVRSCSWLSGGGRPPHGAMYVQGVTYRSFDDVRADPTYPQTTFDLRGFRALTRDNSNDDSDVSCQVYVDVADGQTFEVAYSVDAGSDRATACQRAKQAADWGLAYLLSR